MQQAPIRKTMGRREIPGNSRFIIFSCQRRLPLFKNSVIAQFFQDSLARARQRLRFHLYAWVIMPEHIHLLVRPPKMFHSTGCSSGSNSALLSGVSH